MRNRQHTHSQETPSERCLLCWQSHPAEICPLKGKECFVLHFGAQKDGKEPTSQREAQACYRCVRGKLKTSPLQVVVHQLYQQGHWYIVVIWKQEDATNPLIKELGLTLWLYQTEIPFAALPVEILRELGDKRAEVCIQELGPHLFPLIYRAEIRLTGTRMLPVISRQLEFREADRYEMVGIIDVVSHVELNDQSLASNPIVRAIVADLPDSLPEKFEVILDYKGMRRPPMLGSSIAVASLWSQYEWQLQTYGEIRRKQADALPVVAGVLLYLNEMFPTQSDLQQLKVEIAAGSTDVIPSPNSSTEQLLSKWTPRERPPTLPFDYRLARTLRVIPINQASVANALQKFDQVVERIETCRGREVHGQPILQAWERNPSDEDTCVVCDFRTFCPDYRSIYASKRGELQPRLPRVRGQM